MASELTVSASLGFAKGTVNETMAVSGVTLNVTGTKFVRAVQSIQITTAEALVIGEIGTAGWLFVQNTDATNFVTIRNGLNGADVVKLKAGEACLFRLATNAPYMLADTAAVVVHYMVVED